MIRFLLLSSINCLLLLLLIIQRVNSSSTKEGADQPQNRRNLSADHGQGHQQQQLCLLENERSAFHVSVPESAPKGHILGVLPVIGLSSGPNATIRLRLVQGRDAIRLNPMSKQLVLRKELDREQGISRIGAMVECVPRTTIGHNDNIPLFPLNISVFVTVTDVNDNAPQFPGGGQFRISIPEELPEGTPIRLDFRAQDRDQSGPNSHIRYRIVRPGKNGERGSGGEEMLSNSDEEPPFAVSYYDAVSEGASMPLTIPDPYRPELIVSGRIDYERVPGFFVLIEAEDQGRPKRRALARLEVNVIDVDDQNPVFSSSMYTSRETMGTQLVIEPAPIRAWDADRSLNESIIFTLSGGVNSVNYAIDELSGEVRLLADELVPATLIIRASQLNRPERNATSVLVVNPLVAKNGSKPKEQSDEFIALKISSNLLPGTALMAMGQRYEQSGDDRRRDQTSPVYLDNRSNSLRLSRQLAPGEYNVNITAHLLPNSFSSPSSPLLRSLIIHLTVFDPPFGGESKNCGEPMPRFEKSIYEFEVNWKETGGGRGQRPIRIGQVRAVRPMEEEEGKNNGTRTGKAKSSSSSRGGAIEYRLINNANGFFDIDPVSGVLRLLPPMDPSRRPPPALSELVVMAENSNNKGRSNFVRCVIRLAGDRSLADQRPLPGNLSPVLPLGLLCFLLMISNCATLSLWLGKRRFSAIYDQFLCRYESMDPMSCNSTPPNSLDPKNRLWMLNKALEGDRSVTIVRANEERGGEGRNPWRNGKMTGNCLGQQQARSPSSISTATTTFGRN